jgi:hypothetical protein
LLFELAAKFFCCSDSRRAFWIFRATSETRGFTFGGVATDLGDVRPRLVVGRVDCDRLFDVVFLAVVGDLRFGFVFASRTMALISSSFRMECHPAMPRFLAIWPRSFDVYSRRVAVVINFLYLRYHDERSF